MVSTRYIGSRNGLPRCTAISKVGSWKIGQRDQLMVMGSLTEISTSRLDRVGQIRIPIDGT